MSRVQQYWLPGYGLSRHIVLGHIHYFLGPSASVRPYSYQPFITVVGTRRLPCRRGADYTGLFASQDSSGDHNKLTYSTAGTNRRSRSHVSRI
ncbi:hypothetical protein N7532_004178 [Penicillium argentinense]|uniref:Uncharacterized protein n=1 Tax=Penicillium argentinense TaxID=1131581 RepID=A0A9W9KEN7_9EURO|nr:uncharacterized protein N7532_004178 [Penicillium argentinense]KAJ5103649.1 hypothetical protein N7532_004178 [Penicillium argentinense]